MPQNAAGCRTEPTVSDPSATGTMRAATAAAEPPLDPPATRVVSHGLRTTPNAECSVDEPIAHSSRFVLPEIAAPAPRSFVTTVASNGDTNFGRIFDAHVVGMSVVTMLSLIAIGKAPEASRATCRNAFSLALPSLIARR